MRASIPSLGGGLTYMDEEGDSLAFGSPKAGFLASGQPGLGEPYCRSGGICGQLGGALMVAHFGRQSQLGMVSSGKATATSSTVMLSTMEVRECRLWTSVGSAVSR